MQIHELVVTAPRQMLASLAAQLNKAMMWADAHGMTADDLLQRRLAPDMFPLSTQVKFVCQQARETVWRLTGEDLSPWEHGDARTDLEQLVERTLAFLDSRPKAELDGAEARTIELALPNGAVFVLNGAQFVRDWAIPQFYFHAMTAYAIMRHVGVDLGKADYVPHMSAFLRTPV